ncbi:MAG: hypothetical protein IPM48_14260 [Saprospiraceae bacterium]|nr:hypothetical protein [Saprospiraceae bacterium]
MKFFLIYNDFVSNSFLRQDENDNGGGIWVALLILCAVWLITELLLKHHNKSHRNFKTLIASYVVWVTINFIIYENGNQIYTFLSAKKENYKYKNIYENFIAEQLYFYPFEGSISSYNYVELIIFSIMPLVIFFVLYQFEYYTKKGITRQDNFQEWVEEKVNKLFDLRPDMYGNKEYVNSRIEGIYEWLKEKGKDLSKADKSLIAARMKEKFGIVDDKVNDALDKS